MNRAGERLLNEPAERLLGSIRRRRSGLSQYLEGEAQRTVQRTFPGGTARWGISRSVFREGGLPHQLLVVTDLTRPLREEELKAWQRLVRVLGHELNNSLAPIKSIAGSLESILARAASPGRLGRGHAQRPGRDRRAQRSAEPLHERLCAAGQAAPADARRRWKWRSWCGAWSDWKRASTPQLVPGPEIVIQADADQLEQLLINVIRNAADASLETGGGVRVGWERQDSRLTVWVRDEGPGLPNTANLFRAVLHHQAERDPASGWC